MKGLGYDHWSLAGGLSWVFWVDHWSLAGLSRVFWVISAISSKMYMNIKKIGCRQEGVAYLPRGGEIGTVL